MAQESNEIVSPNADYAVKKGFLYFSTEISQDDLLERRMKHAN